jgi:Cu+-exporting ATPase
MKDNQADGELMMDAKTITDWERSEASVGRPAEHADYVIDGMHCAACVTRVEKAIQRVPGVLDARVNLVEERAQVDFDRASVGHPGELDEAVRAAVERAGYEAQPAQTGLVPGESIDRQDERAEARESDYRERIRRFWIGAALTVPVVLIGHGMWIPGLRGLNAETMRTLHALSGLLTLPLILYVGRGFFTGAWAALRRGESNMDTLVALGTGSAWVYSTVAVLAPGLFPEGTAHPFYEATAVVITLVVLGQALEARAKGRTSRALRALADLRPETAHVIREGREVDVAAADLVVGDVIVVRPGERIPIDGVVRSGSSAVNEAIVTGESMPVRKAEGDSVVGGTMNTDGTLTFEASAVGSDTVLARITEMVRRAQGSKPPIQRLVDIVAGYFVPAVVLISLRSWSGCSSVQTPVSTTRPWWRLRCSSSVVLAPSGWPRRSRS